MSTGLNLPSPGEGRFWNIVHQPRKKTAPLRIELREKVNKQAQPVVSLSKLISFEDTIAANDALEEAAKKVLARAGQVDIYLGVYL